MGDGDFAGAVGAAQPVLWGRCGAVSVARSVMGWCGHGADRAGGPVAPVVRKALSNEKLSVCSQRVNGLVLGVLSC